jgi:hypothetical protein
MIQGCYFSKEFYNQDDAERFVKKLEKALKPKKYSGSFKVETSNWTRYKPILTGQVRFNLPKKSKNMDLWIERCYDKFMNLFGDVDRWDDPAYDGED